jgi:hypothetical protein
MKHRVVHLFQKYLLNPPIKSPLRVVLVRRVLAMPVARRSQAHKPTAKVVLMVITIFSPRRSDRPDREHRMRSKLSAADFSSHFRPEAHDVTARACAGPLAKLRRLSAGVRPPWYAWRPVTDTSPWNCLVCNGQDVVDQRPVEIARLLVWRVVG